MLFRKTLALTKEEIIINKGLVRINEYQKIKDLSNQKIVLSNVIINGDNLKIKLLTKEYIILEGLIKEIIFDEEKNS